MPLSKKTLDHMHQLMMSALLSVGEENEAHKRKLIFEARKTNNGAAIPAAYSKAALDGTRLRTQKAIDAYFDFLSRARIAVDDSVEQEVLSLIGRLTSANHPLHLPPAIRPHNLSAILGHHHREQMRLNNELFRNAQNRLREMRILADPVTNQMTKPIKDSVPKAFISYSWDSEEHKEWVAQLANQLTSNGIKVVVDSWHLKFGHDRLRFMEESISDSDFVLVICTPTYAKKAEERLGGAGYESTIITAEMAEDLSSTKFIPILRSGDWKASVPRWLKAKLGPNLTGDPYDRREFDRLLRDLHGHNSTPPLGQRPQFDEMIQPEELSEPRPQQRPQEMLVISKGDLGSKAIELLVNAAKDAEGRIFASRNSMVATLTTNSIDFLANANPREAAEWRSALQSLLSNYFIEDTNGNGQLFVVTGEGYTEADELSEFKRWKVNEVTLIAQYFNAPPKICVVKCKSVVTLPTEYFERQPDFRSVKEHASILIEGASTPPEWQPTGLEIKEAESNMDEFLAVGEMKVLRPGTIRLFLR